MSFFWRSIWPASFFFARNTLSILQEPLNFLSYRLFDIKIAVSDHVELCLIWFVLVDSNVFLSLLKGKKSDTTTRWLYENLHKVFIFITLLQINISYIYVSQGATWDFHLYEIKSINGSKFLFMGNNYCWET